MLNYQIVISEDNMASDTDIFRSAHEVIKKCGSNNDPVEYALFYMKSLLEEGDEQGAAVWKRIAYTIGQLKSEDP